MNSWNTDALIFAGFITGAFIIPLCRLAIELVHEQVGENEAVLFTRFGKLARTLKTPGWHWVFDRAMPWTSLRRVSLRRDFRVVKNVAANDKSGTTVIADVWLEVRVLDPERAAFAVDDWSRALTDVVTHAVMSILGNAELDAILGDTGSISNALKRDISDECERWGVRVERAFLQKLSVLPDVAQQLFLTVAARLERQKADIEEEGHQRVAILEAETHAQTALLVARAKGQYPAAVGRAFEELKRAPAVLKAYEELYALSQLRPHRTTTFQGFEAGDIRPIDAAMLPLDGASALSPKRSLSGDAE